MLSIYLLARSPPTFISDSVAAFVARGGTGAAILVALGISHSSSIAERNARSGTAGTAHGVVAASKRDVAASGREVRVGIPRVSLAFTNLQLVTGSTVRLDNVSGTVRAGRLTAIMGGRCVFSRCDSGTVNSAHSSILPYYYFIPQWSRQDNHRTPPAGQRRPDGRRCTRRCAASATHGSCPRYSPSNSNCDYYCRARRSVAEYGSYMGRPNCCAVLTGYDSSGCRIRATNGCHVA